MGGALTATFPANQSPAWHHIRRAASWRPSHLHRVGCRLTLGPRIQYRAFGLQVLASINILVLKPLKQTPWHDSACPSDYCLVCPTPRGSSNPVDPALALSEFRQPTQSFPESSLSALAEAMSYYFVIISPTDTPLFELTFGTSKAGGDGVARFRNGETSRYMNQFIVHAALDVVEEVQWLTPNMWLKVIDSYAPTSSHISCFITGSNHRFMLLHQPTPLPTSSAGSRASTISSNSIPHNPTSPQTEDAIRQFMTETYELWVKATMNPFYRLNTPVVSPVFRQRVTSAGRKWL